MEVSFREIIVAFIFSHSVEVGGVSLGWGSCFLPLLLVAIRYPHFREGRRRASAESATVANLCRYHRVFGSSADSHVLAGQFPYSAPHLASSCSLLEGSLLPVWDEPHLTLSCLLSPNHLTFYISCLLLPVPASPSLALHRGQRGHMAL